MTDLELLDALSPLHTVACTIWGEARNQDRLGRIAIGNVIANRVKAKRRAWGLTPKEVCLQAWQFSCWAPSGGRGNAGSTMDAARSFHRGEFAGSISRECIEIAAAVITGTLEDAVDAATHYLTRDLFDSDHPPAWVVGKLPCAVIGSHVFFNNIR